MLVHDETNETIATSTMVLERPTEDETQAPILAPRTTSRGRRPWLAALVVTGAIAGATIVATATGSDQDNPPVTVDDAYDVVESNRVATFRDLVPGSDGASDRVEANRVATLRDLAPGSHGASDRVEANRAATFRDLATAP